MRARSGGPWLALDAVGTGWYRLVCTVYQQALPVGAAICDEVLMLIDSGRRCGAFACALGRRLSAQSSDAEVLRSG
jgi:hypothetical protein